MLRWVCCCCCWPREGPAFFTREQTAELSSISVHSFKEGCFWHDGNQRIFGGCRIGEMKGELFADPDKAVEDFVYFISRHLVDIIHAWEHDGMSKHGTQELFETVNHASAIGSEVNQQMGVAWCLLH